MLEPGVVRFGLGPLTEVVAQHHSFDELAPHLDSSLVAVVAQERVLRGEDLRDDARALSSIADSGAEVPAVLQAFEPDYALPVYRADARIDGGFLLPDDGWSVGASAVSAATEFAEHDRATRVCAALRACVEPWLTGSDGVIELAAVRGGTDGVLPTLGRRAISTATFLGLVAFAAASGGARGRRRGAATGRASAWWVARTATGLDDAPWSDELVDELEFRLEDLELVALRSTAAASWRLELALSDPQAGWSAGISALDLADTDTDTGTDTDAADGEA
jgi:hypothetical protein